MEGALCSIIRILLMKKESVDGLKKSGTVPDFGFELWAVCLKENGKMIGDCGLTLQPIGNTIKPEIGYHIQKTYQRKGYAKEAAIAVETGLLHIHRFRRFILI